MANRKQRAQIAAETLQILQQESYSHNGVVVSMFEELQKMREGTVLYRPPDLESLIESVDSPCEGSTIIEVVNCTTFAAAKSLVDSGRTNPLCLNFASAKNPGGGFLSGSQAQEECLARASGLHQSLTQKMEYYDINRAEKSSLYTNHIIYSPTVPVFRDDDDQLISQPYTVSIVTSPAVNAGAVHKNEPQKINQIQATMEHRIRSVLAVACQHNHKAIVLGAWGCGVFANDPTHIAQCFADALTINPRFHNAFDRVIFAVLDFADETPTFKAFRNVIAPYKTRR